MKFLRPLIPVLMLLLAGCSHQPTYMQITGYAQGGDYYVTFSLEDRGRAEALKKAIDDTLSAIDWSVSGYNKGSLLTKINAGEKAPLDSIFIDLFNISHRIWQETGGAFDVTGAPLFDIWGFGFTADSLPDPQRVAEALALCKEEKTLNFNAIAQGYTCDVVAGYLHSLGVKDMLVDIGEIFCEGHNPAGRGWTIGVDNPVDGNDTPGADIRGVWESDGGACGIVTSGNYRKFYVRDGKKYAHTIDPRTGYPVTHGLLSATVVAPTAAEADALATACMVLGPEAARELILSRPELEGYLITGDGSWMSDGFAARAR